MFLISLVPLSVCETYNDEKTSLALLRVRPTYVWSRVFDALWLITCMYCKTLKLGPPVFLLFPVCKIPTHCIAQVAQARNMSIGEHRHCCVTLISKGKDLYGKRPIVSVTYENFSLYKGSGKPLYRQKTVYSTTH